MARGEAENGPDGSTSLETGHTSAETAIRESDLFAGAMRGPISALAESTRLVDLPANEWVFESHEPAKFVWIVESGVVCMVRPVDGEKFAVVAVHGPARSFGWSSLATAGLYFTSAYSVTPASAWAIPITAVNELLRIDPGFSLVVYRNALSLTFRNLQATAVQMRRGDDTCDRDEECPFPSVDHRFEWKLSGPLVMTRCDRATACQINAAGRCPVTRGPSADWSPFMLRRFAPLPGPAVLATVSMTAA